MDYEDPKKEHNETVVLENCYEPSYTNDAGKWITRDGSDVHSVKTSVMKNSYLPLHKESPVLGRRAKLIREKLLQEAAFEVKEELNQPPILEDYMTTYDDNFGSKVPGFTVGKEREKSTELYNKHPLYASPGMSYWRFMHENSFGNPIFLPGLTRPGDINNPFRKNSNFSKPLTELVVDASER